MTEIFDFNAAKQGRREMTTAAEREVNATAVEALEEMLDLARRGEIKGFAMVPLWHDNQASYLVMGRAGGYTMLGALQMVVAHLIGTNLTGEEDA